MNQPLYREAAFESRIKGFSNPVSIEGSMPVSIMLMGIVVVTIALTLFAWLTDYTRKADVVGFLAPEAGSIEMTSPSSGQLSLDIANGAEVKKGDRLARIVASNQDASGQSSQLLEIQNLEQSIDLLSARQQLAEQQMTSFEGRRQSAFTQFEDKANLLQSALQSRQEDLGVLEAELARSEKLRKQRLITDANLSAVKQQYLSSKQAFADAKSQFDLIGNDRAQLTQEWESNRLDIQQSLNAVDRDLRAAQGQLAQLRSNGEAGIFAPIDGVVTFSQAQEGENVAQGVPLFQISAKSSAMVATLLAPSSAIGFANVGDNVQLRYASFPFREHGVFEGEIVNIDGAAQLPSAINAPINVNEPVYRVTVKVDQEPKSKSGKALRLSPGMTLEGSIIIDKKPILFWLFDPML